MWCNLSEVSGEVTVKLEQGEYSATMENKSHHLSFYHREQIPPPTSVSQWHDLPPYRPFHFQQWLAERLDRSGSQSPKAFLFLTAPQQCIRSAGRHGRKGQIVKIVSQTDSTYRPGQTTFHLLLYPSPSSLTDTHTISTVHCYKFNLSGQTCLLHHI